MSTPEEPRPYPWAIIGTAAAGIAILLLILGYALWLSLSKPQLPPIKGIDGEPPVRKSAPDQPDRKELPRPEP